MFSKQDLTKENLRTILDTYFSDYDDPSDEKLFDRLYKEILMDPGITTGLIELCCRMSERYIGMIVGTAPELRKLTKPKCLEFVLAAFYSLNWNISVKAPNYRNSARNVIRESFIKDHGEQLLFLTAKSVLKPTD